VSGAGSVAFAATATARATPTLARVRGDGQTGAAGTTLTTPPEVRLTDAEGRPVQGAGVAWTVTAGGGSVSPATYTTDAGGRAVTVWTLGPAAGANALTATVAGVGSVTFGADARAGTGVMGGAVKEYGDEQFGTPGKKLDISATVRVTDTAGFPLPGAAVSWAVASGGGSIGYRAETTGTDGLANAEWILGPDAGRQTLSARVGDTTLVFSATAVPPAAGGFTRASGDSQTGHVGAELAEELRARVTDAAGNPVRGVTVTWGITGGGGSFAFTSSSTGFDGIARAGWILGMTPGPQTATASTGGQTLAFNATATAAGIAFKVLDGADQDGTAGADLARQVVVRLTDGDGRPVARSTIAWRLAGDGYIASDGQATDADGVSRVRWKLGSATSLQGLTATASGTSVTVTAVATDVAATLAPASGDGQAAPELSALPAPLVVRAANARGTPAAGMKVVWEVAHGGGSVTPASSLVGPDGTTSASWTLGAGLGHQSVTARAGTAVVVFAATARGGAVATVTKTSGDGYVGEAGLLVQTPVLLLAKDARGNPVEGAGITWAVSSGGRLEAGTAGETRADGTAGAVWRLGPGAGPQTLTATVGGVSATFAVTSVAGHPHRLSVVSGDGQSGQVGTALGAALVVLAEDQFGNRVPGATIGWGARTGDGGTLSPASTVTGADGTARATWTLGAAPGTFRAFAGVGVAGSPSVDFTATATGILVASVAVSPAAPSLEAGKTVQLTAALADAAGTPLTGRTVAWSSGSPGVATVSAAGVVTGVAPGTATVTASSEGRSGSATVTVVSTGDGVAPELRGFSFTPASVDVGSAAAPVEFTFTAVDAGSGLVYASVQVFPPAGGAPGPYCSAGPGPGAPSPSGTWKCTAPFPQGSAPGTWYVHSVHLTDATNNRRTLTRAELQAAGFPTAIQVASAAPDTEAPVVAGLAFTPAAVDVSAGPAPVEFTVRITDAGSGTRELQLRLLGPVAGQQQSCAASSRASGTPADGVWKCTASIPRGSAPGEWYVGQLQVEDEARNRRTYSREMLQAAGFPTAIAVSSPATDVTAPVLTGFTITPSAVNVADGAKTVEFAATATDAGSGYAKLDVLLLEPAVVGRVCVSQAIVGGSPQDGTMKCAVSIPGTVVPGTQYVDSVTLYDATGNGRTYSRAQLQAAGFPTDLAVTR
jgi:hypothetical protein